MCRCGIGCNRLALHGPLAATSWPQAMGGEEDEEQRAHPSRSARSGDFGGALVPVLESWWQLLGALPLLPGGGYYPGRRLLPPPLRAFVDFIQVHRLRPVAVALGAVRAC